MSNNKHPAGVERTYIAEFNVFDILWGAKWRAQVGICLQNWPVIWSWSQKQSSKPQKKHSWKNCWNKWVFTLDLKVSRDGAHFKSSGALFHSSSPATPKTQSQYVSSWSWVLGPANQVCCSGSWSLCFYGLHRHLKHSGAGLFLHL